MERMLIETPQRLCVASVSIIGRSIPDSFLRSNTLQLRDGDLPGSSHRVAIRCDLQASGKVKRSVFERYPKSGHGCRLIHGSANDGAPTYYCAPHTCSEQ